MVNKSVKYWTNKQTKTSPGPKTHFPVLESENLEIIFRLLQIRKYFKLSHGISEQNGSDAFPNELMRFRIEAEPIWEKNQKHFKMQS